VRLSLARATLASAAAQGAGMVFTVLATPYLIHSLGVEPYGVFAVVAVLGSQLTALQMGIASAVPRRLAEARAGGDAGEHAATVVSAWGLSVLAALVVLAAFVLVAPAAWARALHASPSVLSMARSALPPAAAVVALQPLVATSYGILIGEERFGRLSALRTVHGIARVGAAVLVVAMGGGLGAVLWGQAAVDLGAVIAGGLAGPLNVVRGAAGALRPASWRLLALGIPFAGADLINSLLLDAEKVAVGLAGSIADFTYYTVPFTAVMRLTLLAAVLSSLLVPKLARMAEEGDTAGSARLTHQATRMLTAAMVLLAAPLIGVAPQLLSVWVGADFGTRSGLVARVLLVALVINCSVYAAHAAVRARAPGRVLPMLYAAELGVHLVCVFFAVRYWGIVGAAAAWGFRASVDAVAQRVLAARALGAPVGRWREFFVPAGALAGFAVACHQLGAGVPWWMGLGAGALLGLGIAAWLSEADDLEVVGRALGLGGAFRFARGAA